MHKLRTIPNALHRGAVVIHVSNEGMRQAVSRITQVYPTIALEPALNWLDLQQEIIPEMIDSTVGSPLTDELDGYYRCPEELEQKAQFSTVWSRERRLFAVHTRLADTRTSTWLSCYQVSYSGRARHDQ